MAEPTNNPSRPNQQSQTVGPVMTMDQVMEMIRGLREPSDEEKAKKAAELERKKEFALQAKVTADQELNNRMILQDACNHANERRHTFIAQRTGNGDAVALCQRCGKDYKWRATPDQTQQGINLLEYAGLTEQHLLDWEKRYPPIGDPPDRIKLRTRAGKPA